MKKELKTTASEEKRRKDKCRSCGLTEQEMDAALLLIELSADSSACSSSSSVSISYHCHHFVEKIAVERYRFRSESEEENEIIDSNRVIEKKKKNPLECLKSSTKVRKYRSLLDLYQSTAPMTMNSNLHGKRVTADQNRLLIYGSYKTDVERGGEEEERRSDLISDAGSVIMEMRDDDDEMEMTTTHHISSCDGVTTEEEEKREFNKSPALAMMLRKKVENIPLVRKMKFLDFLPT